jgi:hypothetical protein
MSRVRAPQVTHLKIVAPSPALSLLMALDAFLTARETKRVAQRFKFGVVPVPLRCCHYPLIRHSHRYEERVTLSFSPTQITKSFVMERSWVRAAPTPSSGSAMRP